MSGLLPFSLRADDHSWCPRISHGVDNSRTQSRSVLCFLCALLFCPAFSHKCIAGNTDKAKKRIRDANKALVKAKKWNENVAEKLAQLFNEIQASQPEQCAPIPEDREVSVTVTGSIAHPPPTPAGNGIQDVSTSLSLHHHNEQSNRWTGACRYSG